MAGWIKLHRELLQWEWYDDNNAKALFIHCLLKANHKPNKWRGHVIDRGEFVTSLEKLKVETGMSIQKVRTCLGKLEKSACLEVKSNTRFTSITVCNYDVFQGEDENTNTPLNKQITNEQQTDNKQITTNNNDKKEKKDKEDNIPYGDIVSFLNKKTGKSYKVTTPKTREVIKARFNDGFSLEDFKTVISQKTESWLNDPAMCKYLRPETLFGNKFEGYLNEGVKKKGGDGWY